MLSSASSSLVSFSSINDAINLVKLLPMVNDKNSKLFWSATLSLLGTCYMVKSFWRMMVAPKHLAHIPKVNSLPWFWSILKGESHDVRMKKLMLPTINEHGLCLKYILGRWTVTVGDPILLQVLLKDVYTFPKEQVSMDPDLILTNEEPNMGNANGQDWKRQRSVANPVFHRAMPIEVFGQITKRMFDSMDKQNNDDIVDMADYMRRHNFDMEAVTDSTSPYATLYKEAFSIVRDPFVYLFPAYTRIPSKYIPYRNRARKANENLRKILSDIIVDRKRTIRENSLVLSDDMDSSNAQGLDLLTLMIMAAEGGHVPNASYLTDGELVSNLAVFFVAGHETTASATASFMYYLAANPEIQQRARQEVLSVMGDSPEDVIPTREELKQMVYLDNCIHETMRINPPTSGNLPRIVTKDTNLGGFFVPKETRISIELYGVHHIAKYWDQPEVFNPDRFNKKSTSFRKDAIWMPFGYGPRTCIGQNFSLSEQRIVLAMMLKRYTWTLAPNSEHAHGLKNANGGGIGLLGPESLKIKLTRRY
ncbi:Fe-S cluster-binding ribosome biosynthesis protein [Mucor velutinosus]|uniref:Fe-S cluster-binding ribosome biosynthesis protein n=1 Tax=Mucor velutinosus TaxID=708070 RepID=A0AAN7DRN6_9FUNG|nr:Fe-S cluster-binding ribosome biosynthesis protein [Mucor velutinosus]